MYYKYFITSNESWRFFNKYFQENRANSYKSLKFRHKPLLQFKGVKMNIEYLRASQAPNQVTGY